MTSTTDDELAAGVADGGQEGADRLPLSGLLALAMAVFVTVLTEAMPAGLLPQIGGDLNVSISLAGQLVTAYAVGITVSAMPLTAATQGFRRRPVLLVAIGGFAIVNTVTALSADYYLTLAARFLAGVFAGLLWSLVAGHAARMVAPHQQGRAITIAMIGIPLALAMGIPGGAFLGSLVGWRFAFGIMSILTVLLVAWVLVSVPDFPGRPKGQRQSIAQVLRIPGVRSVLFVTLVYVLAHNILYTFVAPFVGPAGLTDQVDVVLLVFGLSAIGGIWITGLFIDRWLRQIVLLSTVLFGASVLAMAIWSSNVILIYGAVAIWGLAFGGIPTLFQTASAKTAGDSADMAQSILVAVWNVATAAGAIFGGVLLDTSGVGIFPWVILVLLVPTLIAVWRAKSHGFPIRS